MEDEFGGDRRRKLRNTKYVGGIVLFVLVAALVYLAGAALLAVWPMWSMMGFGPGWATVALLSTLILVAGAAWPIAWLIARGQRATLGSGVMGESALGIARRRYAAGEINREEYERMRQDLGRQPNGEGDLLAKDMDAGFDTADRSPSKEVKPVGDNPRVLLGGSIGALVILLLLAALTSGGIAGMGSMMGGGMFGTFFMLLFWALVIALIVVLVFWLVSQSQRR